MPLLQPTDALDDIQSGVMAAERCMAAVSQALLQGQPDVLQAAAQDLQRATHDLSALFQGRLTKEKTAIDAPLHKRLRAVAQGMAMQREACVRRLAVVERSLHSVIPSTKPATYAGAVGAYGRAGTQSGAFRPFS